MTAAAVKLRAAQSMAGAPKTDSLLAMLRTAAAGGQATYDFFSDEAQARQELAKIVAKGEQAWTHHPSAGDLGYPFLTEDQPAYVASGTHGKLILQTQLSSDVLQADCPDYKEAGIATMYLVTSRGTPVDIFTSTVEKLGPGVAASALAPALLTLLGALRTFVTTFFTEVTEAAAAGAAAGEAETIAAGAAETAAETAAVDGEIIAEEVALSIEFGPLAIVGLVIAALTIVLMILSFGLSKTMTAWIRIFNTSPYPLQLDLAYNYNLAVKQQPKDGHLPPPGVPPAPPGVTATSTVIYRADYVIQNDSTWKGLGLVIKSPGFGQCPGFTFLIDIPDVGANSLDARASGDLGVTPNEYFDGMCGRNTDLSVSETNNGFGIVIGTNQNRYESPSPLDGSSGYNYEYVVLLG